MLWSRKRSERCAAPASYNATAFTTSPTLLSQHRSALIARALLLEAAEVVEDLGAFVLTPKRVRGVGVASGQHPRHPREAVLAAITENHLKRVRAGVGIPTEEPEAEPGDVAENVCDERRQDLRRQT